MVGKCVLRVGQGVGDFEIWAGKHMKMRFLRKINGQKFSSGFAGKSQTAGNLVSDRGPVLGHRAVAGLETLYGF